MPRNHKWQDIYQILKERILQGDLHPGGPFPTNLELMKEFEVHAATVQNAVNALIRDGLVYSASNSTKRRKVRPLPKRSNRRGDFLSEHGASDRETVLSLEIRDHAEKIPDAVRSELTLPVLFHHTLQLQDDLVVAVTRSFIPATVPLARLKERLSRPGARLYEELKALGAEPHDCEERLVCAIASADEMEELGLPTNSRIPVVRITRKVYDPDGKLLQVCLMVDRADCHEFRYRFPLSGES